MALDMIIRGGSIVDGTGQDAYTADIGIKNGVIAEIGRITSPAARVMDADGAVVTPGFIDVHTHYDGQVSWDGEMLPSACHGVTTAIMGNCGVGFAPVRPRDRDTLIALMEGVEDIPGTALHEGIDWAWESFPQYIDAISRLPRTMDIGVQVPHNPIRLHVMGERAVRREAATPEDIAAMQALVVEALQAGALGFTTADTVGHRDAHGNPTYARHVAAEELYAIGEAMGRAGLGVIQIFNDFFRENHGDFPEIVELAKRSGRPLSFTLEQDDVWPEGFWEAILQTATEIIAGGVDMRAQVAPRAIGALQTLGGTLHPFLTRPSYRALAHLPLAERVKQLRDPQTRARILSEPDMVLSDEVMSLSPRAEEWTADKLRLLQRMFPLDESLDYEATVDRSIFGMAMATGTDPMALIYDHLTAGDGLGLIFLPIMNFGGGGSDAIYTMLSHPRAMAGLSDGGAHVGYICDGSFPTYLLTHWTRDRTRGPKISLPRAVQLQTGVAAEHFGLADRGRIAEGLRADVNVIDYDNLRIGMPGLQHDLPAGGARFLQGASGYLATIVAGQVVSEAGRLTGLRPGRVLRGARTH